MPDLPLAAPSLADEARHLHACLFRQPLDASVIARYAAAHREMGVLPSPLTATVVARRLDAEAVELALRRRGQGGELTRKLQTLCYLVEVRPAYFDRFINARASRVRAWAALAGSTLGYVWKLLKGEYLVRRHGLL